ncbi:MAG: hypothetical protein PHS73_00200 [Candidatus Peribacteraceae bacterium]|nr:hypothetical protein [Candidatus Peribacteraceae bacterium]
MVLPIARTAFLIAGVSLLLSAGVDIHRLNAHLTGQGTTLLEDTSHLSTIELRQHWSAPEREKRNTSGMLVLGTLFVLFGLGLHAALVRSRSAGRTVKVHRAPEHKREARRSWILWMNVRM